MTQETDLVRTCGTCTSCCKTHGVEALAKPTGVWCSKCIIGKGCSAYNERPTECVEFKCEWLKGYGPNEHRPDDSKIVLEYRRYEELNLSVMWMLETVEGALERSYGQKAIEAAFAARMPMMQIPLHRKPTLLLPQELFSPISKEQAENIRALINNDITVLWMAQMPHHVRTLVRC